MRYRRFVARAEIDEIRARHFSRANCDDVSAARRFAGRHLAKRLGFISDRTIHFQKRRADCLRFYNLQRLSGARVEVFINSVLRLFLNALVIQMVFKKMRGI